MNPPDVGFATQRRRYKKQKLVSLLKTKTITHQTTLNGITF
jgi:hypothetical protein